MKMCKKLVLFTAAVFACSSVWSQSEEIEEISLPDVSTVISGGAPQVGKSAISDFTDVLPSADSRIENILPQLPDSTEAGNLNSDSVVTVAPEKTIYVEGLAGGGYPGFITGNFKIYRQTGYSPFKVEFGHESANGYSGRSLTSAFSDRDTFISADKIFQLKNMKFTLNGKFESTDDGLQDQFDNISGITKENLGGGVAWELQLPKGLCLSAGIDGDWYKRYSTVTGTPDVEIEDYADNVGIFDFDPSFGLSWEYKKFLLTFNSGYGLEYDLKDSFYGARNSSRGNFALGSEWKNDVMKLYGSVEAVVGNHIGDNSVIVPFTCGIDFGFSSSISSRKITMGFQGGLDSNRVKICDAESAYRFAANRVMPEETSDWYVKASVGLPIKDRFTLTFDGEFRKTAFGNGALMPDYDTDKKLSDLFGQYVFEQEELTQFNTDLNFAFRVGPANISAGWKAFWVDAPELACTQYFSANVTVQNKSGRFGFDGSFGMSANPDDDNTPEIDLSAYCRLTPAVRLAVSTTDVVKLLFGSERDYAGAYISRSGTASLLVKFFF